MIKSCIENPYSIYIYIYIYIYIILFFHHTTYESPHQPPTRVDNTVSVAQGGTATPGATKQLLQPDRVFKRIIYIYIYTPDEQKSDIILDIHLHFWCAVCDFLKTSLISAVDVIATISWCCVITRERWFRVHFIHAEISLYLTSIRSFSFSFIVFMRYCTKVL